MSQGSPSYLWDLYVDDGGGEDSVPTLTTSLDMSFDEEDTTETGQSGEDNTLTIQRCTVPFEFVWVAGALTGGKKAIHDAAFAKTELAVRVCPAGDTSGNEQYSFNARVHNFSVSMSGPGGTVKGSGTMRMSDGTPVTLGTVS